MNIQETNLQFTGTPATRRETTAIVLHHADAVTCSVEDGPQGRQHLAGPPRKLGRRTRQGGQRV